MNVLIVEDSGEMRRTIKDFTADLVENFVECADGGEALALYETCRPDWVLMDVEMKNTDGISATRQIIHAFPAAKIAILTNYSDDDLRKAAFAAGALKYFAKENLIDVRGIFAAQ